MGANTLRAPASDRAHLETWSRAATGCPLPWPADPELVLRIVAHRLWDPGQKAIYLNHGMSDGVIKDLWQLKILSVRGPLFAKFVRMAPSAVPRCRCSHSTSS